MRKTGILPAGLRNKGTITTSGGTARTSRSSGLGPTAEVLSAPILKAAGGGRPGVEPEPVAEPTTELA